MKTTLLLSIDGKVKEKALARAKKNGEKISNVVERFLEKYNA